MLLLNLCEIAQLPLWIVCSAGSTPSPAGFDILTMGYRMDESTQRAAPCPDGQQLLAFALGALPSHSLAVVGAHIETCPHCRSAVASYDHCSDPFVDQLRASVCGTISKDDAQLQKLVERARQIWTESHERAAGPNRPPRYP